MNQPVLPDHKLLRPIGRGAYGEVWLALNVMGTLRAVKVIQRGQFESDRPYEREFAGIQRYEPVSRSSGGLVHVLHVGRSQAQPGCAVAFALVGSSDRFRRREASTHAVKARKTTAQRFK